MDKKTLAIGFIGAGTTGTALAIRLAQQGYNITAVSSRTLASAEKLAKRVGKCQVYQTAQEVVDKADLVFITTPDDVIAGVTSEVKWHNKQNVVHCSGAHSSGILELAEHYGAVTGCFHPLQTFAGIEQAINNIPGSTFAIEAQEPLLGMLKDMATELGGEWVILQPGDRALYHTAAVFACNYLVTLVKLATDLWQSFGIPPAQATKALIPLLQGSLNNIANIGLPDCLTGPIARGDLGTIRKHLDVLERENPDLLDIYKELGTRTIPIALAKGKIDTRRAEELQDLLQKTFITTRS